ncbi:hypothetical protein [Cohnella sp. GCM10012308]|uniref:hypothetical protein n=1 Tax=Cohnella sp. GCM10012308 TaxID=3317329 RepID=UPI00360710FF
MSGKKKYTVPIMLAIITMLTFLIVVLFSRVLLDGQSLKTERGQRLASSYNYCILYATVLKDGSVGLLDADGEEARMQAAKMLGKLDVSAGECGTGVLVQSGTRTGQSQEDALAAVSVPMQKISEALAPIGASGGALTEKERATLTAAAASADKLSGVLGAYTAPTGSDRFRQMEAGVDWVPVAQRFVQELKEAAAAIG